MLGFVTIAFVKRQVGFTQAHRWGLWNERNPAADATVGRKRASRERHKDSDDSIRQLFAELPEDVRVIIQMGLFYTLGISEVLGPKKAGNAG